MRFRKHSLGRRLGGPRAEPAPPCPGSNVDCGGGALRIASARHKPICLAVVLLTVAACAAVASVITEPCQLKHRLPHRAGPPIDAPMPPPRSVPIRGECPGQSTAMEAVSASTCALPATANALLAAFSAPKALANQTVAGACLRPSPIVSSIVSEHWPCAFTLVSISALRTDSSRVLIDVAAHTGKGLRSSISPQTAAIQLQLHAVCCGVNCPFCRPSCNPCRA